MISIRPSRAAIMFTAIVVLTAVVLVAMIRTEKPSPTPSDLQVAVGSSHEGFEWVQALVQETGFDPPLTPVQKERLAQQCVSILSTYMAGSSEDYLELMNSWGGELRESYGPELVHNRWTQATHSFPWVEVEQGRWTIGRPERNPETGAINHNNTIFDGPMAIQSSLFDFDDDKRRLFQADANALISVEGPVRSLDGSRTLVKMYLLWSPNLERWLPSTMVYKGHKGDGLPRVVF